MPRKKGVPNKRSQMLLRKLEDEHKFNIVNELIEVYQYDKQVLVSLAVKVSENIEKELSPTHGFEDAEIEMYNNANKNCQNVLIRLLTFCYPKLKAMEINQGTSDKVVFNITGTPDIQQSYSPPPPQEEGETIH